MRLHKELRTLTCRCPADVKTALERQAAQEMISLSDHLRRVLVRSLRADGTLKPADDRAEHQQREVA
jgi:hypothetical protein